LSSAQYLSQRVFSLSLVSSLDVLVVSLVPLDVSLTVSLIGSLDVYEGEVAPPQELNANVAKRRRVTAFAQKDLFMISSKFIGLFIQSIIFNYLQLSSAKAAG
jgi:hypothetical protein